MLPSNDYDYVTADVMTDSSSKTGSSDSLVGPPSPPCDDRVRWQGGRRRLAALFRPSVESNVVALVSSALTTTIAVLLAFSVYRLHDRVRVLEQHCIARPSQWTHDDTSGAVVEQVQRQIIIQFISQISSVVSCKQQE